MNVIRTGVQIAVLAALGALIYLIFKPESPMYENLLPPEPENPVAASTSGVKPLQRRSNPPQASDMPAPAETVLEAAQIEYSLKQPVLGQKLQTREIRLAGDGEKDAMVRDIEFEIREGILPKRLFEHTRHLIVRYDQLQKNDVGAGAVTTRFYFEVVTSDSDGDGKLSAADKRDVGISFPDGSYYTRLVAAVDDVIAYDYLPVDNAIQLTVLIDDNTVTQTYSLENNQLLTDE